MENITHYPLLLFATSCAGLWAAAWIGATIRRIRAPDEGPHKEFDVIVAATLTLLGLIIGFSFSMATTRYDLRKSYEEAEANAIGTEYVRAELLPAPDATALQKLLKGYVDQRVQFYSAGGDAEAAASNIRAATLQAEMWSLVRKQAAAEPTPIVALVVAGMNDVLNAQGYTQSAYWNRIPTAAWGLMAAIAICCNLLVGYGADSGRLTPKMLFILPLVVSIAFMLIADIDTPRHGIIRVVPQNLNSLADSLRKT